MVVVRATVIKIARAIIILKPAFLVVPSPGRWSRRQRGLAEGWCRTTGEERLARERSVVDIGRGTGRRRWKRMAAAVTATKAGWLKRTAGLAPCTLGIEVRDDQPGREGGEGGGGRGGEGPARVGHLFPSRTA